MRKNLKEAMQGALSDLVNVAPEQVIEKQSQKPQPPTNGGQQSKSNRKASTKTLKPESS
jgi:hypothetical protein